MIKKFITLAALIFFLTVGVAGAAEVGTTTVSAHSKNAISAFKFLEWSCLSDTAGNISGGYTVTGVSGILLSVEFIPDTTDTPTDGYTVTVITVAGLDILHGVGSSCSSDVTSVTNHRTPYTQDGGMVTIMREALAITAGSVGNAKKFKVVLKYF